LRAVFPTGVASDTVISDGHFQLVERPVDRPEGEDWVQPPPETIPQCEFTSVGNGLAVLARGLPEVEARREKDGVAICLTLLRCVGWLSRDDFPTRRRQNAGPTLATPDAQCSGEQRFRYAVTPDADVKALSRRWRTPIPCVQGVADGAVAGGRGLLRKQASETCISAVKRHASRDTLVVRLYNLSREPVEEQLHFGFELKHAWRTNLLEKRVAALDVEGAVRLTLRPHEICTVEVEPAM
jgi:alpha-mannosidase